MGARKKPAEAQRKRALTQEQVDEFEMIESLCKSFIIELRELARRKQGEVLSVLKVDMINKVLTRVRAVLEKEPTLEYLHLLDSDILPTSSDALLIMSQYESAMQQFRNKNTYDSFDVGEPIWKTSKS